VSLHDDSSIVRMEGGFRRIGLVGRQPDSQLEDILRRVLAFSGERGLDLVPDPALCIGPLKALEPLRDPAGIDLLVTLGGDGTLLRGVRQVVGHNVPVLGGNLGRLGFLTSVRPPDLEDALSKALAGEAYLDPRFTLEGRIINGDGAQGPRLWALNDLVLHKGGAARVTRLDLEVGRDGKLEEVGSFSADGVIVATPTGSTAYSLSAGGPIIAPTMDCIVVTPISPHTMAMRPLVLPDHVRLTIRPLERYDDLVVTADGQVAYSVGPGDRVEVEKGAERVSLVRFQGQTFFRTLRRVLNWAI